jgi:hypothetical protein
VKRGTPHHPKTLALAAILGVDRCTAVGILEGLFHWAGGYARRGDVGKHSDAAIASGVGSSVEGGRLVAALVECGWLDTCGCHRLRVHDWPEHADQAVHKTAEVKRAGFLPCYGAHSGKPPEGVRKKADDPLEVHTLQPAQGRRQTADGTWNRADGRHHTQPERPGPQAKPDRPGGDPPPERRNPLIADRRVALEREALLLAEELAALQDRDPMEVMAEAARYEGGRTSKLNPATMSDDRLGNTVLDLRATLAAEKAKPRAVVRQA